MLMACMYDDACNVKDVYGDVVSLSLMLMACMYDDACNVKDVYGVVSFK